MNRPTMLETPDLSSLERRTYHSVIGDGITDVAFGLWLVAIAIAWHLDGFVEPVISVTATVGLLLGRRVVRRWITEPRLGQVQLHPKRIERLRRGRMLVTLSAVVVPLVALPVILMAPELRPAMSLAAKVLMGGSVVLGGYLLDVRRLYAYGAVMALMAVVARTVGWPHEWGTLVAGVVVVLSGLVVLAGFLRRHPLPDPVDA